MFVMIASYLFNKAEKEKSLHNRNFYTKIQIIMATTLHIGNIICFIGLEIIHYILKQGVHQVEI